MPDTLPIGGQVALSPDQIAQMTPAELPIGGQVRLSPEQRKSAGQFDPLQDFSSEQLAELQKQTPDFSVLHEYAARPDLQEQPGMNQKIADAYHLGRVNGSFLDKYKGETGLGTAGNVAAGAAKTVWETAKGFGKQAWNYAQALATPVGAMVTAPFTTPETTEGMFSQAQRQVAENVAGTESSLLGLGKTVAAGAGAINRKLGIEKPLSDYTPEEKQAVLFDALRDVKKQQAIATGQGPILGSVGSNVVEDLKQQGLPVRPEEVQELAAGDPFSWYAMGKAFHAAGDFVPAGVTARAARLTQAAGNLAAKVGGKTVETAADVAQLGADAAAKVLPTGGALIGAVKGAQLHGPAGLVVGAGAGLKAGQKLAQGAAKISSKLGDLSGIGEQIAGKAPMVSPLAQAGQDLLHATPGAGLELAKGAAFDAGLIAATSEESPDERAGIGFGTVFGALGAAKRVGGRVLSGQIIAPRSYGATAAVPSSKAFPVFDAMHADAVQNAAPGVVTRLNAIRSFLKGAAPDTDVFLAKDQPSLQEALKQSGFTDEQAQFYSKQNGFFTTSLPDQNGNKRPVIIARNVEAAPHEAFHAIQDVIGEDGNREVDKLVYDAYKDQWDHQGSTYARRFNKFDPNKTWQENVVDLSGWGRADAAEKISREAYNKLSEQQGGEPSPADVHQMASAEWDRVVADAAKNNPGVPLDEISKNAWRDVLSPEEAKATANRYLARELAAENFDAVFKHGTAGNEKLIPRLANVVGNVVSAFGGEPLAGRESEVGQVPLKFDITKKVGEVLPKPTISPGGEKAVSSETRPSGGGIPRTLEEQQAAAQDARDLAAAAPEQAPTATGTTKNPREILGHIAEAIAQRTGVKLNYLSAPDEPAAATTSKRPVRRAIIEAFRTMPTAARALWEKTFFPERVIKLKGDRYQVLGYAPEVFASNAHKLAQTLADLNGTVNSPYELDLKNRTFTEQGWKDLFNDVQNFVKNQVAGKTGAGEKLVVPQDLLDKGFYNPPVGGKPGEALDQRRADFINLLFNLKVPETPRITGGQFPRNLAGQAVSEATKPGRVVVPVRPRGKFAGEAAQKLGIEGQSIMEVNPVRAEIEAAAQKANIPMPSMIEAEQRLALEHINDVQGAPEAPQFRGNTLTLTAGFQPPAEAMETLKSDEGSKVHDFKGKYGGGGTGWAYDVGSRARTLDDLKAFRNAREVLTDMSTAAVKAKDYTKAMDFATRAQVAREAYEWATGVSMDTPGNEGSAESFRARFADDPNAKPPIPGGETGKAPVVPGELHHGQFSPSENPRAIRVPAIEDEKGTRFEAPMHLLAYSKALDAGFAPEDLNNFTEGFLTNDNKFLNRTEAFKRAEELGQIKTEFPGRTTLTSEHMRAEGSPELKGQFQPTGEKPEPDDLSRGRFKIRSLAGYWLSPQGQFFSAHPSHYESAEAYITGNTGKEDPREVAYKQQWVRVNVDGTESGHQILLEGPRLNNKQREVLEDAAFHQELPVMNDSGRVVIESTAEFQNPETQFSPGKKKEDWEFKKAPGTAFSKAWILPNGQPWQLGGQWHHEALNENPEIAKKYGIPTTDSSEENRVSALQKGFARVNMGVHNGLLTVEARAQDWRKLKPSVERMVDENLPSIDRITVNLMNAKVDKVVDSQTGVLFDKDTPAEKMENIPFITLGEARGQFQPLPEDQQKALEHIEEKQRIGGGVGKHWVDKEHESAAKRLEKAGLVSSVIREGSGTTEGGGRFPFSKRAYSITSEGRKVLEGQFQPGEDKTRLEENRQHIPDWVDTWTRNGRSAKSIADQLNYEGYDNEGVPWTKESIKSLRQQTGSKFFPGEPTGSAQFQPMYSDNPVEDRKMREAFSYFSIGHENEGSRPWMYSNGAIKTGKENATHAMSFGLGEADKSFKGWYEPDRNLVSVVFPDSALRELGKNWASEEDIPSGVYKRLVEKFGKRTPSFAVFPVNSEGEIPFEGQYQPSFEHKDFESELEKIRSGKSGGQTFTTSGAVWNPPANKPVDIVTLASVNIPQADLNKETFQSAVAPYEKLFGDKNIVTGAFAFEKDGKPNVSIDINAVVPQKFRDNTLKFAKDNDQNAIWDATNSEVIPAGGEGNTKLTTPDEILSAVGSLTKGKPVSIEDIKAQPAVQEELGGMQESAPSKPEPLTNQAVAQMTRKQLLDHYPEAVVPGRRDEPVPSDIRNSPLAKQAGSEEKAIDAYADKMVDFSNGVKDTPEFKEGAKWYREIVPQLKKMFGADSPVFVELLAATSPQTNVTQNWVYAVNAFDGFKSGKFDTQLAKFEDGLQKIANGSWESWLAQEVKAGKLESPSKPTPAAFLEHWINTYDLKPRQANGKLFGTHSVRILRVFARKWVDQNTGLKTHQFMQNLLGTHHGATIDLWADRTMRRLGYRGFKERWRVLPLNATGVTDPDFKFSQKVFTKAAERLGMNPDDLQGALWFAEKKLWQDEGWGKLDLGSFSAEVPKTEAIRAKAQNAEKELGLTIEPRKTNETE